MSILGAIARNTALKAGGEILTKLASLVFYAVMARKLGSEDFGHYMFALSLVVLLTSLAGFGTDGLLTREVARDREELHRLFWTSVALKSVLGVALTAVALGVTLLGDYPAEVHAAVAVLGIGTLLELLSKTVAATFLAFDDLRPATTGLILQRFSTAIVGIAALLAGARVVPAALIYLAGAALGLAYVSAALYRRDIRPRRELSVGRGREVAARAAPFGLMLIITTIVFRIDATILSLMKGGEAVGLYSAAYRALESVLFLPYAIENALFPTFARLTRLTTPALGTVLQGGLKAVAATTMPVGVAFVLFGGPILDLLYGPQYEDADHALLWLGGAAVLYGFSQLSVSVLTAQGRTRALTQAVTAVMVLNVVGNLLVIPRWSYTGAAAVTAGTELVQAALLLVLATRVTGRVEVRRILAGPVPAAAVMCAVGLLVGTTLTGLVVSLAAYAATIVLVERTLYPDDLGSFARLARGRLGRA